MFMMDNNDNNNNGNVDASGGGDAFVMAMKVVVFCLGAAQLGASCECGANVAGDEETY